MASTPAPVETRCGYVTLVGRPNAGKSTLMNRLVGRRLSIVTPKAQTTWRRVTGIRTSGDTQMIFLDTPGLLRVKDLLQRSMLGEALEALREADVVLLLLDPTHDNPSTTWPAVLDALVEVTVPIHVAINKLDQADPGVVSELEGWAAAALDGSTPHRVSALEGAGVEPLFEALRADLPPGPFLYPEDFVASDPVRFFVAELVRETVFEQYDQEIPYSVFCAVQEFREEQDPLYIQVNVYVERKSQKGILIGAGGAAIRALGTAARAKIEHFLDARVYLDLWVKPLRAWRKSRASLSRLGFRVPEDDDAFTS